MGLLIIVTFIVIVWLTRQAALKLAQRVGVDPETMLFVLVLAAAWLSLQFGPRPPPVPPAVRARQAREIRAWRQYNARPGMPGPMIRRGW